MTLVREATDRSTIPAGRLTTTDTDRGLWLLVGALVAGLAVAAGAFGTHSLRTIVMPDRLVTFETAVRYQMYHGLALVALAGFGFHSDRPILRLAAAAWLGGVVVFCGSVYGLALGGPSLLGALAPIGGVLFLSGWLLAALAGFRHFRRGRPDSVPNPER